MTAVRACFVCLGNICRSPLAEGVLLHLARERGVADRVEACSRGVGDWHLGQLADARMRHTARTHGVDLTSRSELVRRADFQECDLILSMDGERHRDLLAMAPPGLARKVVAFRAFDPEGGPDEDVPDPYYGGPDGFEEVFRIVGRTCDTLLDRLLDGAYLEATRAP